MWADFVKKKKKCPHAGGCHLCLDPLTRKEAKHKKTKIANRALSPYCTLSFRTPVLSPLAVGVYPVPEPVSYRFQKICCFFLKKSKARVGVKLENPLLSRTQNEGRMLFSVYLNSVAPRSPPESTRGGRREPERKKKKKRKIAPKLKLPDSNLKSPPVRRVKSTRGSLRKLKETSETRPEIC